MYLIVCYSIGNGVDYESGPYSVSISAGETTSVPLSIPINDDDILEGNEEFHLSFNLSLLPNYVNVTNPKNATVIIMDDDGKYIIISSYTYIVIVVMHPYTYIIITIVLCTYVPKE